MVDVLIQNSKDDRWEVASRASFTARKCVQLKGKCTSCLGLPYVSVQGASLIKAPRQPLEAAPAPFVALLVAARQVSTVTV